MTDSILMQTLKKHGLERFDPSENGEKFDPNLHDAQIMTKMEDKEDGTVFDTIQKGYMLNGRVVRVRLFVSYAHFILCRRSVSSSSKYSAKNS